MEPSSALPAPKPHLANYRLWAAVLLAPVVIALVFRFDGLYGQDPYGYAQDAWNLHEWLRGGPVPPSFFWTRGYSGLGAVLSLPFDSPAATALALQAVSILSLALTAMWTGAWMRDRYPTLPNIADHLTIMIVLAPFLFRAGLVVMSDMPAIACATLALWQIGRYLRTPSAWRRLAWASLACGLMVAFRYALVPLILLPMLGAAWTAFRHRRFAHLALPLLAGLPMGLLWLSLPDALPAPAHSMVSDWALGNLFTGDFVNVEGQFHFPYPNLAYVLLLFVHPGYVGALAAFTALGVWAARKAEKRVDLETGLLLGTVFVYMMFIGGLPFQNQRFLLPVLPIVLLLYAPYWAFAFSVIPVKLHKLVWPALALVSAFLIHHAMRDIRRLNREEAYISQSLAEDGVRELYTFDLAPALQFRDQGLRIYNFYDPHMPLPRPGAHVLSRFPDGLDQWAGLAPARNWARIQDSCDLQSLFTFPHTDWTLYVAR